MEKENNRISPETQPEKDIMGDTEKNGCSGAYNSPEQPGANQPVLPDDELLFEKREEERRKNSVGCISTISYVILILGISIILSTFVILSANDMFAFVKSDKTAEITIGDDLSLRDITKLLEKEGIIKYPSLFTMFANVSNMSENISPGTYTLSSSMDYRTILSNIKYKTAAKTTVKVTIPEGMEQKEIFALLEEKGVCEAWELYAYAQYYKFNYSFIKDLPMTETRLEGYLFPDTYTFYLDDSPARVIRKFLTNFNKKWGVDLRARLENINMSIHDIMKIASMIEKEAKFDDERPIISSVIHNRLQSSNLPYLEIDATVLYALGVHKEQLTQDDLEIDSPYNTYKYKGLPIGPICNPGLAAIKATLFPEDTKFLYYVARKNGYHFFSKTLAEHRQAIKKADEEVFEASESTTTISD